jgi:hypothetical protein
MLISQTRSSDRPGITIKRTSALREARRLLLRLPVCSGISTMKAALLNTI